MITKNNGNSKERKILNKRSFSLSKKYRSRLEDEEEDNNEEIREAEEIIENEEDKKAKVFNTELIFKSIDSLFSESECSKASLDFGNFRSKIPDNMYDTDDLTNTILFENNVDLNTKMKLLNSKEFKNPFSFRDLKIENC